MPRHQWRLLSLSVLDTLEELKFLQWLAGQGQARLLRCCVTLWEVFEPYRQNPASWLGQIRRAIALKTFIRLGIPHSLEIALPDLPTAPYGLHKIQYGTVNNERSNIYDENN